MLERRLLYSPWIYGGYLVIKDSCMAEDKMVLTDFLCTECVKKSDLMKSKDLFFSFLFIQ